MRKQGFTLIELLVVLAIVAFLSVLSIPSFLKFLAKSKRSEAYMTLRSLYLAEKAYHMEHGSYAKRISGTAKDSLGWKAEGTLLYTYGFPSSCVVGDLKAPGSALKGANASDKGFIIAAAGDIDNDGVCDVITIDQDGKVKLVVDDLNG